MATPDDYRENLIRSSVGQTFSLKGAVDLMKELDKHPTITNGSSIRWVNVKTGRLVVIGYT